MAAAAYLSLLTPAIVINGFECCSFWHFESEIFLPEASVVFKLTDEPKTQNEAISEREIVSLEHSWAQIERQSYGASTSEISSKKLESLKASHTDKRLLTSKITENITNNNNSPAGTLSFFAQLL